MSSTESPLSTYMEVMIDYFVKLAKRKEGKRAASSHGGWEKWKEYTGGIEVCGGESVYVRECMCVCVPRFEVEY